MEEPQENPKNPDLAHQSITLLASELELGTITMATEYHIHNYDFYETSHKVCDSHCPLHNIDKVLELIKKKKM